jgi:short-subunit dehydrogenase
MEVKKFGVKVILINPGDFHTSNSANRRNFLAPIAESDPYQKQFEKTLSVIEHDETIGWEPEVLAKKIVSIVESENPSHRYIIASFEQKLAVVLKYILPGKWFSKILEGHYKIK